MRLLAKWVTDEKKRQKSTTKKAFTEVELWIGGREHRQWHPKDPIEGNYKIAFTGRLLDSTDGEVWESTESGIHTYRGRSETPRVEVYEMSDRKLAVYRDFRESLASEQGATCLVFAGFQELCKNPAALETLWDLPQEDDMQMPEVAPYVTRDQKDESITLMALAVSQLQGIDDAWKEKGQGKEVVKDVLLNIAPAAGATVEFTEQDIDSCYEEAKREAFASRFLKSIADALGAEVVVRIGQSL